MTPPVGRQMYRHALALTSGTMVQAVVGLGTQILLMRLLMPSDYGTFAVVLAGCSLIQTLLSLRLNVLIIRLGHSPDDECLAELYQAALVWETVVCTLAALAWLTISGLFSVPALMLLGSLALGQWVNQVVAFYERGMDYTRITMVETSSQLLSHVFAIALALAGAGAITLYLRELAAILCRTVIFAGIGALVWPKWRLPTMPDLMDLWHRARAVWSEGLLEGLFSRIVVLTSGSVAGIHGAGLFSQSQRLAMLPHQFLAPVVSRMSTNLLSRTKDPVLRRKYGLRLFGITCALLVPAVVTVWVWAPALVPWLLGEHWREAGDVLRTLVGVIAFLSLFDLLRSFCYSQGLVWPVLSGRAVQIAVFLIPVLVFSVDRIETLGWLLSAAMAAGFAVTAALVAMIRLGRASA